MVDDNETRVDFHRQVLEVLGASDVPFLVAGAYAMSGYAGFLRRTGDLDVVVRPEDRDRALDVLQRAGWPVEITDPIWLAKGLCPPFYVDVIFSSPNGVVQIDDGWFEHAAESDVLGVRTRLSPAEELIWSKAYVMERTRYDGADVAHLFHACADTLDWSRLLRRFGDRDWRVLLSHLVLFGFVYPAERARVPDWVVRELTRRMELDSGGARPEPPPGQVCQGTLLSSKEYLIDLDRWGYDDARLVPFGGTLASVPRAPVGHGAGG